MSWFSQILSSKFQHEIHETAALIKTADARTDLSSSLVYKLVQESIEASIHDTYGTEWILQGPRGSGQMETKDAVEVMSKAIIELADQDHRILALLVKEIQDAYIDGYVPSIDIRLESKSPPMLGVTVGERGSKMLIDAKKFTYYLDHTPHLEGHVQIIRKNRKNVNEIATENTEQQPTPWTTNNYLRYASEVGYLVNYTYLIVDSPQILKKFRDQEMDSYQPRTYWDKQGPSWEFQIGGPLGDAPFDWLHDFRPDGGSKYSRREAFNMLLNFVGLDFVIDTTPPPYNTGGIYTKLRDYKQQALRSLMQRKPSDLSEQDIIRAFNEGWQGKVLGF